MSEVGNDAMSVRTKTSVLITGGRGFVGRALVKLLLESGLSLVSLDRAPVAGSQGLAHDVCCDISDHDQLQRIFEQDRISHVIHLAAVLPTAAQRDPVLATQVNVVGSLNLLELARQFGVRRFVFASSLSIYGTWDEGHVVSEADRAAPEDVYGAAKVYVEKLGAAYREKHGMDFVSLRIGRVVGPGANSATSAWRSQILEFLSTDRPLKIEIPYVGSERVLLTNVEDVARALLILLQAEKPAHAVYNAPCESIVVQDLKREVERLNANISVKLGGASVIGNPRLLDFSRFQKEFGLPMDPIFAQLRCAAGGDARRTAGEDAGATG